MQKEAFVAYLESTCTILVVILIIDLCYPPRTFFLFYEEAICNSS